MRGGAVKLVVERAMLVQHAVQNVRRYSARRETGHFRRGRESLWRHAGTLLGKGPVPRGFGARHENARCLPCEYAKCKNRPWCFRPAARSANWDRARAEGRERRKTELWR